MATLDSDAQGQQGLEPRSSRAPGNVAELPTELIMLVVRWRVLQAGPRLHADLFSLCLASSMLRAIAEPHMYRVISLSSHTRLPLLEGELGERADRRLTVKAAWWDSAFTPRDTESKPELPVDLENIEHVAWYVGYGTREDPTGCHFALQSSNRWNREGGPTIRLSPILKASQTPRVPRREVVPCVLVEESTSWTMRKNHEYGPSERTIWAMHLVVSSLCHWIPRIMDRIGSITHVTITLYPTLFASDSKTEHTLIRMLRDNNVLQSLLVRDARGEGTKFWSSRKDWADRRIVWDGMLARINDERLTVQMAPDFDWSLPSDKTAEAFTRQQWEEAVYQTGSLGPWSRASAVDAEEQEEVAS